VAGLDGTVTDCVVVQTLSVPDRYRRPDDPAAWAE
jgi:hypothetical protein